MVLQEGTDGICCLCFAEGCITILRAGCKLGGVGLYHQRISTQYGSTRVPCLIPLLPYSAFRCQALPVHHAPGASPGRRRSFTRLRARGAGSTFPCCWDQRDSRAPTDASISSSTPHRKRPLRKGGSQDSASSSLLSPRPPLELPPQPPEPLAPAPTPPAPAHQQGNTRLRRADPLT